MSRDESKSYFPFQAGAPQPDSWVIEFACPAVAKCCGSHRALIGESKSCQRRTCQARFASVSLQLPVAPSGDYSSIAVSRDLGSVRGSSAVSWEDAHEVAEHQDHERQQQHGEQHRQDDGPSPDSPTLALALA